MGALIFLAILSAALLVDGNHRHGPKISYPPSPHGLAQSWRHRISAANQFDDDLYDLDHQIQLFDDIGDDYHQQGVNNKDFQGPIPSQLYASERPAAAQSTIATSLPKHTNGDVLSEVLTPVGTIRGKEIRLTTGKTVYAFLGIPFAEPPTGALRFKRPIPAKRFETPYDATELPNACIQQKFEIFEGFSGEAMWNPNTNISEDCLYLNIWVPQEILADKGSNLSSVLIWIYGGGYFSGSSSLDIYNGAYLAGHENVVVVSSQYRMGPLGFMYLGDIPGNMGLWDQNLALKWTYNNIASFGGDPNSITLFGESCGAVSVSYHLLSAASKGYFKRAVMMSAAPTDTIYGFVHPNILKTRSYKLARLAGCDIQKSNSEIVECLRSKDALAINSLLWSVTDDKMLDFGFKPTMDGKFINDFPGNIISSGRAKRTDLMIGTVANEGSYFILYKYLDLLRRDQPTSVTYDQFIEIMKDIFGSFTRLEQEAIISYYTNWENPEDGLINQQKISDAVADYYFVCPVRKFANAWSNRGLNVFYYHFTHRSSSNPWGKWLGVMHGNEIEYFFGQPLNNGSKDYTPGEQQLSALITKLLGNFARTGVPSENWGKYSTEVPIYLDLNGTIPSDETTNNKFGPRAKECVFWNTLLPKLRQLKRQQCPQGQNFRGTTTSNYEGIHGGQGFHFDSSSDPSSTCDCSGTKAHTHIPIAPGVPKNFHQTGNHASSSSSGFGQNTTVPTPIHI